MAALPYPSVGIISTLDLSTDGRVFPQLPGMDFIVDKTPEFSTGVKQSSSGREVRNAYYPYPLYNFSIRTNFMRQYDTKRELERLWGFFNYQLGRFGAFFYFDPEDNAVVDMPFGTGDGTTSVFQLMRTVGKGLPTEAAEPVYACWKLPAVKVNGTPTSVTVDIWGRVHFTSAPADDAVLTWTGNFLYVCRFEDDKLSFQQMMSLLWSQDGMGFRSIRP